jgi:hypothetical protein
MTPLTPTIVSIEDGPKYPAFIRKGDTWNGWEKPYFTKEVAEKIGADYAPDTQCDYIAQVDGFALLDPGEDEVTMCAGEDVVVDGHTLRLYPIRSGSWIWSCVAPAETDADVRKKLVSQGGLELLLTLAEEGMLRWADQLTIGGISSEEYAAIRQALDACKDLATPDEIERAKDLYEKGSDAIEIDDVAMTSRGGDPGIWVGAWVWVPDKDDVCFGCQGAFEETAPSGILYTGHRFCSEDCKGEYEAELSRNG